MSRRSDAPGSRVPTLDEAAAGRRLARIGPIRRIAVLRALQLGDLLCAVPALRALRAAYPAAHTVLVGLPWARSFAARFHRYLDGFLEFPGHPGLPERPPDLGAWPRFLADAHDHHFDLVIQLHGSGEITNPLATLLGGRIAAGFFRPGQFCPDPDCFLAYPDAEPEPRRLLGLMQFLGLPPRGEHLEFPISDDDRRTAHAVRGRLDRPRYVCVHPGARAVERRWAPEAFARVGDALAARGLAVVLTGVQDEAPLTSEVRRRMRAPAVDLAGRLTLGSLAALLADARVLVCNDTGVSHLAAALGVPSVVVYTASDPARWAPLDRRLHRVVRGATCEARRATGDVPGASLDRRRATAEVQNAGHERDAVAQAVAEAVEVLRGEGLYAA